MPTSLELIREISRRINGALSDDEQRSDLWTQVQILGSEMERDNRFSEYDMQCYEKIKRGVTDIIVAHRDGLNPIPGPALVALGALEGSIAPRTIGPDGWPKKTT